MRRLFVFAVLIATLGCNRSPTSADDPQSQPHGRLSGIVTIGPNCPVESTTNPCPTPPDAYALRKVLVYSKGKTTLLYTVDIDSRGAYYIDLKPNDYTIDIKPNGIDRSSDVPKDVTIHASVVTTLNISIDTGLR